MIDIEKMDAGQFARLCAAVGRFLGAVRDSGLADMAAKAAKDGMGDEDANEMGVELLFEALPKLLEEHTQEVYGLVAACKGMTLAEYEAGFSAKAFLSDVKEVMGLLSDGALADFLA